MHPVDGRLTTSLSLVFPEVYTNGERPARHGLIDKQRYSLPTPAYGFGWVLSSIELFEALDITDEPPLQMWLDELPSMVDDHIYPRWEIRLKEDGLKYK
jgi:hypothetical protein